VDGIARQATMSRIANGKSSLLISKSSLRHIIA
jgi:hypothetical protein